MQPGAYVPGEDKKTQPGNYIPKKWVHPDPNRPPITVTSVGEEDHWKRMGYEPPKSAAFSNYPKMLWHPDHEPARMVSEAQHGPPVSSDSPHAASASLYSYVPAVWEEERFPPVIARNAEEEALFAAQGYLPDGESNAEAFAKAQNAPAPEKDFAEYPKWATPPWGGDPVLVKSAAEEAALKTATAPSPSRARRLQR